MATAEHETANGHEAAPRRFALADGRPPAPLTDPPAERRLVAAVRDFPTLLETLPLKPADLSDRTLRALYAAALRLRDRDVPIFPETVAAEAARMLDGDEDRLLLLLRGLPESPVEIAAGDAERLSELARRRRYRARLQAALEAIADDGTDPDDLIAGLAATAE
ncbi:MAG TPA: hypothetical protein VF170_09380, partial [Planctomycetaceae bacterium]